MLSYKVTVRNPSGLHLRPAGLLCGEAIKYKSSITFQYAGGTANAKSVLSVLGACVKSGDEITLVCEGEDEQAAIDALVAQPCGRAGEQANGAPGGAGGWIGYFSALLHLDAHACSLGALIAPVLER